ncbi:MAG: hypothetical protein HQ566_00605 [Candidatus Omnitrophica bacterium]|nr:hypothetical protein [Candidatus Omnitrophota bacterium]
MFIVKLIKAILVIFVFLATFFPIYINVSLFASEIHDFSDELRFIKTRIEAVAIDMYAYVGWAWDLKNTLRFGSKLNRKELQKIKAYLSKLDVSDELGEAKKRELQLIDKIIEVYDGIESKDLETVNKEFREIGEYDTRYHKEVIKVRLKHKRGWEKLPADFEPIDRDIDLMKTALDKHTYLNAVQLITWDEDYVQAYEALNGLKGKYEGTPFEDYIMLRISDCFLMAVRDFDELLEIDASEEGIKILSDIVNKKAYSPLLYEAFHKWRTKNQSYNYGASNTSEIPNDEYNEKLWQVVQVIKAYLKDNPDDAWAEYQIDALLDLGNIKRGGMYGNSNAWHRAHLYSNVLKDKPGKIKPKEEEQSDAGFANCLEFLKAVETTEASRSLQGE